CLESADSTHVEMPVSLRPGTIVTPPFWTLVDLDCGAEIAFSSKVNTVPNGSGVRMFEYSVGPIQCPHGAFCPALGSLLDISWQLQNGGKTVAEGNSHEWDKWDGTGGADRIIHIIGFFKVKKWHRYRFVLHVNRDASVLNEADPAIILDRSVDPEKIYAGVIVCGPLALVSGLIGLALIYPAAKRWRSPRQSTQR
ncbi:MAG: hypothetical protein WBH24_01360, partial [Candidatus Acidiferrum sp.]